MTGTWDKIYILDCEAFYVFKNVQLTWSELNPFCEITNAIYCLVLS